MYAYHMFDSDYLGGSICILHDSPVFIFICFKFSAIHSVGNEIDDAATSLIVEQMDEEMEERNVRSLTAELTDVKKELEIVSLSTS